jgi:hypothetical protein
MLRHFILFFQLFFTLFFLFNQGTDCKSAPAGKICENKGIFDAVALHFQFSIFNSQLNFVSLSVIKSLKQ